MSEECITAVGTNTCSPSLPEGAIPLALRSRTMSSNLVEPVR